MFNAKPSKMFNFKPIKMFNVKLMSGFKSQFAIFFIAIYPANRERLVKENYEILSFHNFIFMKVKHNNRMLFALVHKNIIYFS